MKLLLLSSLLLGAHVVYGYEYALQFSAPGGSGLVVAGYQFSNNTVIGDCSYYISANGSGRGSHGTITYYYNTCTWDQYGNLLSTTPVSSAPLAPPVLFVSGTEVVYGASGTSTTGIDSRGFGFVNTPSPHYTWTNSGLYAVIPDSPYTVVATLTSDGDFPLQYSSASVVASVSGAVTTTAGTATVASTTCSSSVPSGTSCTVTVTYKPTAIRCTTSPYGYAYTNITLSLVTNGGLSSAFTEGFTITGLKRCGD